MTKTPCLIYFTAIIISLLVMTIFSSSSSSSIIFVTAQTTATTPPPNTTANSNATGNTTTTLTSTTTTTSTTTSTITTVTTGNGTFNGTTPPPTGAAAEEEAQALQWYHVAVAVAIGFLLAFGTCYAVCVWQQTAVRDYEGSLENFLKEVGLLRRQLADEVQDREEMQAKMGTSNDLFEKYKTEQEAIQAEAEKKEAIKRNLANAGHGDDEKKDGGGKDKAKASDPSKDFTNTGRTQNMISFRQQRAQEIKNLQALSRIGSPLGAVGGTGRLVAEPSSNFVGTDPKFKTSRNIVQVQAPDTRQSANMFNDPLQLALADALSTHTTLHRLKTSAQMRSLQTQAEL